jgi:hypothetical protein
LPQHVCQLVGGIARPVVCVFLWFVSLLCHVLTPKRPLRLLIDRGNLTWTCRLDRLVLGVIDRLGHDTVSGAAVIHGSIASSPCSASRPLVRILGNQSAVNVSIGDGGFCV